MRLTESEPMKPKVLIIDDAPTMPGAAALAALSAEPCGFESRHAHQFMNNDTPITNAASVDSHGNPLSEADLALENNINHGGFQAYVKAEVARNMERTLNHIYAVASGEDQVCDSDTEAMAHIAGYILSKRVARRHNDKLRHGANNQNV